MQSQKFISGTSPKLTASSTDKFKTHCIGAIYKYELEKKTIPLHRQKDMLALENLLYTHDDFTDLSEAIETYFTTMKTGWWIFKTGNSRLMRLLKPVIEYYRNDFQRDMHDSIHGSMSSIGEELRQLRQQNEALKLQLEDLQRYAEMKKDIARMGERHDLGEGWYEMGVSETPSKTPPLTLTASKPIAIPQDKTLPKHSETPKVRFWKTPEDKHGFKHLSVVNPSIQSMDEGETLSVGSGRLSFVSSYRN